MELPPNQYSQQSINNNIHPVVINPQNQSFQQQSSQNISQLANQNIQQISNPNIQQSQNQNFSQQQPNMCIQQTYQNSLQQPNQNLQQQATTNTVQSSNPNFPSQQQNINISPTNQSIQQQPSNTNTQPQTLINTQSFDQKKKSTKTQSFPITYDGSIFVVDPICLSNSSLRFNELISPYIQDYEQIKALHLEIHGSQFTKRNMNNFLRLCQNLPTDVQNSEMKEICEIAKMFKANQIYDTGIAFIQNNLDPNFNVPDDKYESGDVMTIAGETNCIQNDSDVSDSYFEDFDNSSYRGTYINISSTKASEKENENDKEGTSKQTNDENQPDKVANDENQPDKVANDENQPDKVANDECHSGKITNDDEKKKKNSVIYMVRVEDHTFKCPRFKFVHENRILYTAKQKYNEIYIAEGAEIHISKKENHVAHITQNEYRRFNTVTIGNDSFNVMYVNSDVPGHCSLDVSFQFHGKPENWSPRSPRYDPIKDKYYLNFHGEHNHRPIPSSKNIVLQNRAGHPTFIVRKMDKNLYEIECNFKLDPLIALTIGLSDIVGPYVNNNLWINGDFY